MYPFYLSLSLTHATPFPSDGRTALHLAAVDGRIAVLHLLIQYA
jgi:ankyrin repeat protein